MLSVPLLCEPRECQVVVGAPVVLNLDTNLSYWLANATLLTDSKEIGVPGLNVCTTRTAAIYSVSKDVHARVITQICELSYRDG